MIQLRERPSSEPIERRSPRRDDVHLLDVQGSVSTTSLCILLILIASQLITLLLLLGIYFPDESPPDERSSSSLVILALSSSTKHSACLPNASTHLSDSSDFYLTCFLCITTP